MSAIVVRSIKVKKNNSPKSVYLYSFNDFGFFFFCTAIETFFYNLHLLVKQEELRRKLNRKQIFNGFFGPISFKFASNLVNKIILRPFLNCQNISKKYGVELKKKIIYLNHSQKELTKGVKKTRFFTFFWIFDHQKKKI